MNDVSYLQSQRMTAEERAEFNAKYGLDKLPSAPLPFTGEELFASHNGHAEYHCH